MSEQQTETQETEVAETPETPETPDAPDTVGAPDTEETQEPIEGPGDDEEGEQESADAPAEGDTEPGVQEAQLYSERELEKRMGKIDSENARHRKRIGEIMEEDALHLVPCPVCMDGPNGWVFDPQQIPLGEEQRERTLQLLNLADFEEIPQASWAQTCGTCNGHGRVKTGSKKDGRETTDCLDCGGSGWHNLHERQRTNGHAEVSETTVTGPTVYGTEDPDPRVASLTQEGWMVIPPTILPTG